MGFGEIIGDFSTLFIPVGRAGRRSWRRGGIRRFTSGGFAPYSQLIERFQTLHMRRRLIQLRQTQHRRLRRKKRPTRRACRYSPPLTLRAYRILRISIINIYSVFRARARLPSCPAASSQMEGVLAKSGMRSSTDGRSF